MISCLSWVPRGASAAVPERYEISEEALQEIKEAMDQERYGIYLFVPILTYFSTHLPLD